MESIPIQSSWKFPGSILINGGVRASGRQRNKQEKTADPDSLRTRLRRIFCFDQRETEGLPLVWTGHGSVQSIAANKVGGNHTPREYQRIIVKNKKASEALGESSGVLENHGGRREPGQKGERV